MQIEGFDIICPKCGWEPQGSDVWVCDECHTRWNTFQTRGKCPYCSKKFTETQCPESRGGCGLTSLHSEWYLPAETRALKENKKKKWFWQRRKEPPITTADKEWIEESLSWLRDLFTPEVFKSLGTVTPDKSFFDVTFDGKEEDAEFVLKKVASIMNIKPWEIQLMYFSNKSTEFSEGISETP